MGDARGVDRSGTQVHARASVVAKQMAAIDAIEQQAMELEPTDPTGNEGYEAGAAGVTFTLQDGEGVCWLCGLSFEESRAL